MVTVDAVHPGHSIRHRQRTLPGLTRWITVTDFLVIFWAVVGAQLIRLGAPSVTALESGLSTPSIYLKNSFVSAAMICAWMLMLRVQDAYDHRLLGHGPEEYKAVANASLQLVAAVAVVNYGLQLELARSEVALAIPSGMLGLLTSRYLWRKWLTLHREHGLLSTSVLVVGDRGHLTELIRALDSVPDAGYRVIAACCGDAGESRIGRVPVLGDDTEAAEIARQIHARIVACTSSTAFDSGGLRRLGWALEGQNVDLVVVPRLTDVAGPRVLTRPVAGLSLLHVEAPVFAGPQLVTKTVIDRVGAAMLLILVSPLSVVK